jgi:hypothetical protein
LILALWIFALAIVRRPTPALSGSPLQLPFFRLMGGF